MQTSSFQCGHCGKLIAVEVQYLDRPVRCPHCLKEVLAQKPSLGETPPTPPEPAPEPAAALPDSSTESPAVAAQANAPPGGDTPIPQIAAPLETPRLELTTDLTPPTEISQPAAETLPDLPSATREGPAGPLPAPRGEPSDVFPAPVPLELPGPEQQVVATPWSPELVAATPLAAEVHVPEAAEPIPPEAAVAGGGAILPRPPRPARVRSGVSIWFFLPLVSYSIFATCLVVILWNRLQTTEDHPLIAFLPDAEGDAPGVVRKPKGISELGKRKLIDQPVPKGLKMRLGETRTVGALAVTPRSVTRERVGVATASTEPEQLAGPSLVLHLLLRNVSDDETFQPLDRYFDRKWREASSPGAPPLTLLEAGPGRRFFGGPAAWRPRRPEPRNNDAPAEFIYLMKGDKPVANPVDRPLGPGESEELFVCTDGDDPRADDLCRYQGEFLWRVHLRRGLVSVRGRDGREREVPAAAVVGVVISGKEVGG